MAWKNSEIRRKYNREYNRSWYSRQPEEKKIEIRAKVKARKDGLRIWFENLKSGFSCEKCPEKDIACLDFHHEDPKCKEYSIAKLLQKGVSIDKIVREIEKCIVLCSNCHRKLHYKRRDNV